MYNQFQDQPEVYFTKRKGFDTGFLWFMVSKESSLRVNFCRGTKCLRIFNINKRQSLSINFIRLDKYVHNQSTEKQ